MIIKAKLAAVGLSLVLAGYSCQAQKGDPSPDGSDMMNQAFGKGNGVRGTVTAAAGSSFTIRTDDGDTYRVLYSENTRLMKDRQPIEAGDIHLGDMLIAGGVVDAKAKTVGAVLLFDVDARQVRDARAAFGKTWVAGKVTNVHELRITIERADDKRAQVVTVDENTSFRKRRESVTLGDVKVGDFITAQGALHTDVFLASTLRVVTAKEAADTMGFGHPHSSGQSPVPPPGD